MAKIKSFEVCISYNPEKTSPQEIIDQIEFLEGVETVG